MYHCFCKSILSSLAAFKRQRKMTSKRGEKKKKRTQIGSTKTSRKNPAIQKNTIYNANKNK